jgi:hypothetical protein
MKVIIAGSRTITEYDDVVTAFQEWPYWECTEIVSGGARGVDRLGERIAKEWNLPVTKFIPGWDEFGKRAGYLRNAEMAKYADGLIAVWDGQSKGTKHMIDLMLEAGKPVYVYER